MLVAVVFLIAFLMAVKKGQYKDTYTPSIRILFDDKEEKVNQSSYNSNKDDKVDHTEKERV